MGVDHLSQTEPPHRTSVLTGGADCCRSRPSSEAQIGARFNTLKLPRTASGSDSVIRQCRRNVRVGRNLTWLGTPLSHRLNRKLTTCRSIGSVIVTTTTSRSLSSPGASLIHARIRASLSDLDEGEFTEGYELDRKRRDRSHPHGRLRCGFS